MFADVLTFDSLPNE